MNARDIDRILSTHGIDKSVLYKKVNLLDEVDVLRGMSELSRIRAALREIVDLAKIESL